MIARLYEYTGGRRNISGDTDLNGYTSRPETDQPLR